MYDSFIKFLHEQLQLQHNISEQQLRMLNNMEFFFAGLSGKPVPTMGTPAAPPTTSRAIADDNCAPGPQAMTCTRRFGAFALFERDPAAEPLRQLMDAHIQGGDANSVNVLSCAQTLEKEEENMKYICKRSDGRWQGSKTIDGKRVYVYGRTKAEAYEKFKQLKNRKQTSRSLTFIQFAMQWLETYKKDCIRPITYKNYLRMIRCHLDISTPLNRVTPEQLQRILSAMPPSRAREETFQLMRQIFAKALQLGYVKRDPTPGLVKGKKPAAERRALTLEEQKCLLAQLGEDKFSRRVMFYLCTGARPAEIATVKKEELRPGWVKINGTKTKRSVRWVKVSDKLVEMLKRQEPEFFKFDPKKFRQHLQRVCDKAGIAYDVDSYTLRHTFATNLYILRVPEKDRQTYMGHAAGSAMTNDVYTTFTPDTTPQDVYDIYGDWLPKFE